MTFFIKPYCFFAILLAAGCTRVPIPTSSTSNYTVNILQKRKAASSPLVFGHINEIYPSGVYHPVMLAYVSVANQGMNSDENGNYSVSINPGEYDISVRCVGYKPIVVKGVHIAKRDSVRIDFHLAADTVKL